MADRDGRTGGIGGGALREAIRDGRASAPKDLLTSVGRALEVLETIAASPQPLPAKAVAQRLGLSLGTSYHVLHTLEHAGYVVRLGHGCYGLGTKLPALYRMFHAQFELIPPLRPLLTELADRAGEDTYLAVIRSGEIVVADVVEGSRTLHFGDLGVGFSPMAHATALGKVLLAAAPEETVDAYLHERRLRPFTRRTLVERRHIKRQLRAIGELGLAKDLEELAEGCCCVAVPVLDASGTAVASIGLSTPAARWRSEQGRLILLCREIGARATEAISGGPRAVRSGPRAPARAGSWR
jgi:DNA-binding IclR family transcriptional regulator